MKKGYFYDSNYMISILGIVDWEWFAVSVSEASCDWMLEEASCDWTLEDPDLGARRVL